MFKWIKRIIKIVLLLIVLTPIIMLIVMYKGYTAPIEDFETQPNLSFNDIASNKLDTFLADDEAESFNFVVTSSQANAAMKSLYAQNNPDFGTSDTNIDEDVRKYAIAFGQKNGGLKGVTVAFDESGLTLEAGIDAGFSGIYYQTTLFLDLDIEIEAVDVNGIQQTQYKLVIKNIKFGNLPILWMYDAADWIVGRFNDDGLSGLIENVVSDFGNYDLKTKSIWVNSEDLINLISSPTDPNRAMIEALLGFIDEESLLISGFAEDEGGIGIQLGKMRSSKVQYQTSNQIDDETELDQLFENQLNSLLLSSLGGGSSLNFDMHEDSFNQLIEYYIGDGMDMTQTFMFDEHEYTLETQPLFAQFVDNKVHFTIIMKLYKTTNPANFFQTDFTLVTLPSISSDKKDLIFTVDVIHIGDDTTVSNDKVLTILELVGENEIIVGNQIILKDFMGNFANQSVNVDNVFVVGKYIRFVLTPTGLAAQALQDLQNAIDDALDQIFADPEFASLAAHQDDPAALLDALNELSPEEQAAFYEALSDELGDALVSQLTP